MRYIIAILSGVVLLPVPAATQAPERTPWGDPDLQGVWTNVLGLREGPSENATVTTGLLDDASVSGRSWKRRLGRARPSVRVGGAGEAPKSQQALAA